MYTIPVPSLVILVSAVLVLSCGQTDRITDRIIEADDRYTQATPVGVNNNYKNTQTIVCHVKHEYKMNMLQLSTEICC